MAAMMCMIIITSTFSRDIAILIVLLWFSIVHYSACFSAFFTFVPTLVENFNFLNVLVC